MTVRRTALVSRRYLCTVQWLSSTLEELLLELGLGDLNLDSLVHLLVVSSLVVGIVLDGGGEEGVDEGGLAQARLANKHHCESEALATRLEMPLIGQIGKSNKPSQLAFDDVALRDLRCDLRRKLL